MNKKLIPKEVIEAFHKEELEFPQVNIIDLQNGEFSCEFEFKPTIKVDVNSEKYKALQELVSLEICKKLRSLVGTTDRKYAKKYLQDELYKIFTGDEFLQKYKELSVNADDKKS